MAVGDGGSPDPLDVALGARIRAVRKTRNLSQERLADAVGVTFQQIQKYERGANRVSFSRLALIAAALNTPLRDLIGVLEESAAETHASALSDLMRIPGASDLVAAFRALPDEPVRRGVIQLVQELAKAAEHRENHPTSRPA